jgi:hypothetical protein
MRLIAKPIHIHIHKHIKHVGVYELIEHQPQACRMAACDQGGPQLQDKLFGWEIWMGGFRV